MALLRLIGTGLLVAMLAFGGLFGALGVVLAVPATVVLSVAYEVFFKMTEGPVPSRNSPST